MPIYEYLCGGCGYHLDALQKLSDAPLVDCPECAAPALKRQMSAPSFRLKGAGWYETDFKNDKRKNIAESDSTAEGKAGEKSDTKADAGADGKAAAKGDKPDARTDKPDARAGGKSADARPETGAADKSASKPAAETRKPDAIPARKQDDGKSTGAA